MAIAIPAPFVSSQGPFFCSIAPVTRAAGGVGTVGSPVTFTAYVDAIDGMGVRFTLEEISGMGWFGENNLPVKFGFTLQVDEIIQQDSLSVLMNAVMNSGTRFFRLVIQAGEATDGTLSTSEPYTFFGTTETCEGAPRNGKSVMRGVFRRFETGSGQLNPMRG